MIDFKKKIYIAGHRGLVGSAIERQLRQNGYTSILTRDHSDLDLTNAEQVGHFFHEYRPEWVFLAAAKVGGIFANEKYPVEFLLENLKIQNNVIENCFKYKTQKLIFLGSSCIYPKFSPQPIPESALLTSALEPTNESYALAKIAGIKLCQAYNKQYGTQFISLMPSNLYGINDNYHAQNGHVIPMLLRRFHQAKIENLPQVKVWGSGRPKREFLFSDDLARACIFLMEKDLNFETESLVNVGTGSDISIAELAEIIKYITDYKGEIVFDSSYEDGTPRKLLDISKIKSLGWSARIDLHTGLQLCYNDFLSNENLRL